MKKSAYIRVYQRPIFEVALKNSLGKKTDRYSLFADIRGLRLMFVVELASPSTQSAWRWQSESWLAA